MSPLYKIDKTYFSSQFGSYQIYETWKVPLIISGSIANGHANQYQTNFTFTNDKARARVSIERADTGLKTTMTAGSRLARNSPNYIIYQSASTEIVQTDVHYQSGGTVLTINFSIVNNTGASISLVAQQLNIIVDFYDAPLV